MLWFSFKDWLRRFRDDERGSFMVESVIALPLLFWTVAATYEFFEAHRYKSVREKATYTIADMLSRETSAVTDIYIDNAKALLDAIVSDDGINQLRVTLVRYTANDDTYRVDWSEVRGTGSMAVLTDTDIAQQVDRLPILPDGEQVILVETVSNYDSLFDLVMTETLPITTRLFTSIRFAPQLCFNACTS